MIIAAPDTARSQVSQTVVTETNVLRAETKGATAGPPTVMAVPRTARPTLGKRRHYSNYYGYLVVATLEFVVQTIEVLITWVLIGDWYHKGQWQPATLLLVGHWIRAGVMIAFDYANTGRLRYILLDLAYLRIFVEYVGYVMAWRQHRGKRWEGKTFRATVSYETFVGSMWALVIQSYYLGYLQPESESLSSIQSTAYVFCSLSALMSLMHFFSYVSLDRWVYIAMLCKAALTTATRTTLAAYLLGHLGAYMYLWLVFSFLLGLALYYFVRHYRIDFQQQSELQVDDPLGLPSAHRLFASLIALNLVLAAFPFAPTRSISDWWAGYLLAEVKMQFECSIMLIVVLVYTWRAGDEVLFWVFLFFCISVILLNLVLLAYLQCKVGLFLAARDIYSDRLIEQLFAHLCGHWRLQAVAKGANIGGRLPHAQPGALEMAARAAGGATLVPAPIRRQTSRSFLGPEGGQPDMETTLRTLLQEEEKHGQPDAHEQEHAEREHSGRPSASKSSDSLTESRSSGLAVRDRDSHSGNGGSSRSLQRLNGRDTAAADGQQSGESSRFSLNLTWPFASRSLRNPGLAANQPSTPSSLASSVASTPLTPKRSLPEHEAVEEKRGDAAALPHSPRKITLPPLQPAVLTPTRDAEGPASYDSKAIFGS